MTTLSIIVVFLAGFVNGIIGTITFTIWLGHRAMKKKAKQQESLDKVNSMANRMKRLKEITNEMLDLSGQTDGPQKNSLHGKYKNSIVARFKELDEEKNQILKSMLADGHDPELTTVDSSGTVTKMKLSKYLAHTGADVKSSPKKTQQELRAERMGKFTVFKGGKDDSGDTSH